MKKLKLLILGILSIIGLSSYSFGAMGTTNTFIVETYTQKAGFLGESQLYWLDMSSTIGGGRCYGNKFNLVKYYGGTLSQALCNGYSLFTSCGPLPTCPGCYPSGWAGTGNNIYTGFNGFAGGPATPFGGMYNGFTPSNDFHILTSLESSDFGTMMLKLQDTTFVYSIGSGRFSGTPTSRTLGDYLGGVRLFFENIGDDDNFINPVSSFDFVSQSSTQQKYAFLERFTSQGSYIEGNFQGTYQSKSINDSKGITSFGFSKGKHFGLNGLGYSFAYNSNEDPTKIKTTSFGFGTVASNILNDLNTSNTDYSQYIGNVGIFKANTYGSIGSDTRIIAIDRVVGSDYRNQLAYEIFDCGSDPTDNPYDILKADSNCQSLQYGLLGLYSGGSLTSEILPFDVLDDDYEYTIGGNNSVLNFFFNGVILGYTEIENDGIVFKGFQDFESCTKELYYSPAQTSLKLYFMPGGQVIGDQRQENHPVGGGNGGNVGAGGGGGGWGDEIGIAQEPFDPTSYIIQMYASCYGYSGNLPEGFGYSGYYTDCNIDYTGFANTFGGHIQSGDGYSIVVYDSGYDILDFMCSHTSYFNYAFCEDLDKYQGSQVGYNVSSFPPKMTVIASGFAWVSQIGSGGYLYDPNCYGAWCSEVSLGPSSLIGNTGSVDTGSTESGSVGFPSRFDIPDLAIGEIFSLDYFKNFISSNLLFACPFVLNTGNVNITLPEKFESYLGNYNPLNPIKCFTKAFKVGKDFTLYKSGVLSFDFGSGEYLFNSDSDLAKTFYSFFDIILSLGIVLFFLKIFKLLK